MAPSWRYGRNLPPVDSKWESVTIQGENPKHSKAAIGTDFRCFLSLKDSLVHCARYFVQRPALSGSMVANKAAIPSILWSFGTWRWHLKCFQAVDELAPSVQSPG